jgi:flagellar biogenesis protein FliO
MKDEFMRKDAGFRMASSVAGFLALLCLTAAVAGGTSAPDSTAGTPGTAGSPGAVPLIPGAGGLVLKLAVSLAAVVALILVLQRVARRYGGALGAGGGTEKIRVLSQRPVGPRLSLALIQVMDRTFLVGISPQGIRRVADLGCSQPAVAPAAQPVTARATQPASVKAVPITAEPAVAAVAAGPASNAPPQMAPASSSATVRPLDFAGELERRLSSLRQRYPSVGDLESGLEGGKP